MTRGGLLGAPGGLPGFSGPKGAAGCDVTCTRGKLDPALECFSPTSRRVDVAGLIDG